MALTKKVNGKEYEVLRFPMKNLQISQGCNGQFSHQGANAVDACGKDTGIEETFAPCSMKLMAYDSPTNGNAVFFESLNPVLWADGSIDYMTLMLIHDNDISDIKSWAAMGRTWKQYDSVGDEGTCGMASGNHCHLEVAHGKFKYMYARNQYGVYYLPGSVSPDKAFVVDGCVMYNDGQPTGSGSRLYWKTSDQIPGVDKPKEKQPDKQPETSAKGWIGKDGSWQYMGSDGKLCKSKWIEDKKVWYYIKSNTYMAQSEWCELLWNEAKHWFYFGKSGVMMQSCWYEIEHEWYYFNANGVALKDAWVATDGEWYWVDSKCKLVKDCTIEIQGEKHAFDTKGRWIKPAKQEEVEEDPNKIYYGCDISNHNKPIDLTQYDFVIIRAAWGTNMDDKFEENVAKCEKLGIPWGAYIYSYALDPEGAKAEADYLVQAMKGRKPKMGLWFDYEDADGYKAKRNALTKENSQAMCETFFNRMDEIYDGFVGIYCNPDYLNRLVDNNGKWDQWLAHWTGEPNKKGTCVMHQYKVENSLDLNVSYVPLTYYNKKR